MQLGRGVGARGHVTPAAGVGPGVCRPAVEQASPPVRHADRVTDRAPETNEDDVLRGGAGRKDLIIPDDPGDRPHKLRTAVRVILVDPADRVLLFEDSDPGLPGLRWWVTPGGGIDPGETEIEAAVREIAEETGFALPAGDLQGPVARRVALHGYSDQVLEQAEAFFVARVEAFTVDIAGHTAEEQVTLQQHRWWSEADLLSTDAWIWPAELVELWRSVEHPDTWPRDLGLQEESTRAV